MNSGSMCTMRTSPARVSRDLKSRQILSISSLHPSLQANPLRPHPIPPAARQHANQPLCPRRRLPCRNRSRCSCCLHRGAHLPVRPPSHPHPVSSTNRLDRLLSSSPFAAGASSSSPTELGSAAARPPLEKKTLAVGRGRRRGRESYMIMSSESFIGVASFRFQSKRRRKSLRKRPPSTIRVSPVSRASPLPAAGRAPWSQLHPRVTSGPRQSTLGSGSPLTGASS